MRWSMNYQRWTHFLSSSGTAGHIGLMWGTRFQTRYAGKFLDCEIENTYSREDTGHGAGKIMV